MARFTERRREMAFGAGLLAIGLCAVLGGEAVLRVRAALEPSEVPWDSLTETIVHEGSPMRRLKPGVAVGRVSINSLGFRGPEIAVPKPPRTVRVAFLGTSVFVGAELPFDRTIPGQVTKVLEHRLGGCAVDVVNFSGPRYTIGYMTDLLRRHRETVSPDAYVLLGGSIREVLKVRSPELVLGNEHSIIERYSLLMRKLSARFRSEQNLRDSKNRPLDQKLSVEGFRASYREILDAVAVEFGSKPVTVVNAGIRANTGTDGAIRRAGLAASFRGLGPDDQSALRRLIRDDTEATSQRRGWTFLSPIDALAPTPDNFLDALHLSAAGSSSVAEEIAQSIFDQLRTGGHLCVGTTGHAAVD